MNNSIFDKLKNKINEYKINEIIKRKDLIKFNRYCRCSTIDIYKLMLIETGFLKRINKGEYMLIKNIPKNLKFCNLKNLYSYRKELLLLRKLEKVIK